ncbi:hypothetical protein SUGI_0312290 [Cryptomeria japonica]|uniref:uncharacterized protein LOC131068890 n=1 Tax=Cryptomeria japonica TaxID=3369 RepID=UPI002408E374|nr:uncharacterized protein LOC131068890 [Cryptomeria japonica]GLJ17856.1 hypothetical protein SUGI_0312290 [Cryptomeria japonica]
MEAQPRKRKSSKPPSVPTFTASGKRRGRPPKVKVGACEGGESNSNLSSGVEREREREKVEEKRKSASISADMMRWFMAPPSPLTLIANMAYEDLRAIEMETGHMTETFIPQQMPMQLTETWIPHQHPFDELLYLFEANASW